MGEAKRRKESLGENYGKEPTIAPWLPVTKTQTQKFMSWTSTGAWIGIALLAGSWIVVRFVGPVAGWWQAN